MDARPGFDNDVSPRVFATLGLAVVALATFLRFSYADFGRLTDGDQAAIAFGAISLERDVPARRYNFPEQIGYYGLARGLYHLTGGGDLTRIRDIMIAISPTCGVLLTLLGLLAFPRDLSRRARLLVGFGVLLSPLLWRVTTYGNTALPSATAVLAAFVAASRLPGWRGAILAAVLHSAAMLFRSDAILEAPALAFYLWKREGGSWRQTPLVILGVGLAMWIARMGAAAIGAKLLSDQITYVLFNTESRGFWMTYFYWGIGPTVLLTAAAGWPALGRLPVLWKTLLLATGAPFLFYFTWATTPRYAMLLVMPIAVCGALGIEAFIRALARRHMILRVPGLILLFALLCQHLFISQAGAMPGTLPGGESDWFKPMTYSTGDGRQFYGAPIMQKWFPLPRQPIPQDAAGKDLAALAAADPNRKERWLVIVDYWDDISANAFHLITHPEVGFTQKDNIVTFGNIRIDFCFRPVIDALDLNPNNAASARTMERLRTSDRIFREMTDAGRTVVNKFRNLFGNGVGITPRGVSGDLVEITLPPGALPKPASAPASAPATDAKK